LKSRKPDDFNSFYAVAPQSLVVGALAVVEPAASTRLVGTVVVEAGAAAFIF